MMASTTLSLPRYLVLEPRGSVRLELTLPSPSCEIDVRLENPAPERSFVLVIAETRGTLLQRVRLAGGARIYFAPRRSGLYLLFLSNPGHESVTLFLHASAPSRRTRPRRVHARKPHVREAEAAGPTPGPGGKPRRSSTRRVPRRSH
ncbi:MAG: hypothetical protein L3K19_06290 [Thermoplasmata archaeon]|nr:hypothetical protein [Thermoplasmata archaeon]